MIEVEGLTQRYGSFTAVRDVSFEVDAGEVVGFLGPNGAGKTTTLRVIAGFLRPTEGRARLLGKDVEREPLAARASLGYLPEHCPLWLDMTVRGHLEFVATIRGLSRAERRAAVARAVERCGLEAVIERTIGDLSKGYRQRTGLAAALVHDPPILVLDEPTSGLDPRQVQEIRSLVREVGRTRTVLFSTHVLQEVEATCRRAIIIRDGTVVADGPIDELLTKAARGAVRVRVRATIAPEEVARALAVDGALEVKAPSPTLLHLQESRRSAGEGEFVFEVFPRDGERDLAAKLYARAVERGFTLTELAPAQASLEQVFLSVTGKPA